MTLLSPWKIFFIKRKFGEIQINLFCSQAPEVPRNRRWTEANLFNVSRITEGNIFPNIKKINADEFHRDLLEPTGLKKLVREEIRYFVEYIDLEDEESDE